MYRRLQQFFTTRLFWVLNSTILFGVVVVLLWPASITITPTSEAKQMEQLALTKERYQLSEFTSDGCSGGISAGWENASKQKEQLPFALDERYFSVDTIPFEAACTEHDRAYHQGTGGYVGRLQADNELRDAIMRYGITEAEQIAARYNLATPEQAVYLYEIIAEAVYRGVRLGGAPCTGKQYAWGYGYDNGSCIAEE